MKKTLLCVFFLLLAMDLNAQSFYAFNIDTLTANVVKASFYSFGANGDLTAPITSQIQISENSGTSFAPSSVVNSSQSKSAFSAVLMFDISGSINSTIGGNTTLSLAKAGAKAWIKTSSFSHANSETSIGAYDNHNYIVQDFTKDTALLSAGVNRLGAMYGTNFNSALTYNPTSAFSILKTAKNTKKVIVFLTDGISDDTELQTKITTANAGVNALIYFIVVNGSAPASFQNIVNLNPSADKRIYENVNSIQDIENIYRAILKKNEGIDPSVITWSANTFYNNSPVTLKFTYSGSTIYNTSFKPAQAQIAGLDINEKGFSCPITSIAAKSDTITIKAVNQAFNVTAITSTNSKFAVTPTSFSIAKGGSQVIILKYTPTDSLYNYAKITITNDKYPVTFYASGGFEGKAPNPKTIKADKPVATDTYIAGTDTLIQWSGILPSETVDLEYSTNSGTTWSVIKTGVSGLSYKWTVPTNLSSTTCKIRVSANTKGISEDKRSIDTLKANSGALVNTIAYTNDGASYVTGCGDNAARLWNANINSFSSGVLKTFKSHTGPIYSVAVSADDSLLVTGANDKLVKLWNLKTGTTPLKTFPNTGFGTDPIKTVAISPNKKYIASAGMTAATTANISIWNVATGVLVKSLVGHGGVNGSTIYKVKFIDTNRLISCSHDKTFRIWDVNTGSELKRYTFTSGQVSALDISKDGTKIIVGTSDFNNNLICLFQYNSTANTITQIGSSITSTTFPGTINSLSFNNDATKIAAGFGSYVASINTDSFTEESRKSDGDERDLAFHPTLNKIAVAYNTALFNGNFYPTAGTYFVGSKPMQSDTSALFTVVKQTPTLPLSYDMGICTLGQSKEQVFATAITNSSTKPLKVDSIYVDNSEFTIVGSTKFYVPASASYPLELKYTPFSAGASTGQLKILINDSLYSLPLSAIAFDSIISFNDNRYVDFGINPLLSPKTLSVAGIENLTASAINGVKVKILGPNASQFSLTIQSDSLFNLSAFGYKTLNLTYTPTLTGRVSTALAFYYKANYDPAIITLYGESNSAPQISTPDTLKFDKLTCFSSILDTILVKNIGTQVLNIDSVKILGANSADFQLTPAFTPTTINKDSSFKYIINFTPKDTGLRQAQLRIVSNSYSNAVRTVVLIGNKDSVNLNPLVSSINLGDICSTKGTKETTITIKNLGSSKNTFTLSSPSGRFTITDAVKSLNAGETKTFHLRFNVPIALGANSETIQVIDTICNKAKSINVIYNVYKSELVIVDDTVTSYTNSVGTKNLIIKNNGPLDIKFNAPSLAGSQFEYVTTPSAPFTVPANGGTIPINIKFTPSSLTDTILHAFPVTLNFLDSCASTQVWTIKGLGKQDKYANISVNNFANQRIICKQSTIDSVAIKNTGNIPLYIISATSSNSSIFSVINFTPNTSIAPNDSAYLYVRFTPNDRAWKNAIITITSNSSANPTKTINIAGKKDSIILSSSPSTIDLGTYCPNDIKHFTISVKNFGDTSATFNVSSPQYFTSGSAQYNVNKNDSVLIPMTFTAPNAPSLISSNFGISEAVCGNSLQVALKATVEKPALVISADTIYAFIGDSNFVNYTFKNNGTRDVIFNLPTLNPPLSYGASYGPTFTVQANQPAKSIIKVYFKPTQLSDTNLLTLPLSLTLTPCSVAQPWTIYAKGAVEKVANISVNDFPNQRIICKSSSIDSVKITNTGNGYLKLMGAVSSLPLIFAISSVNPLDLIAPNDFRWLRVTFTPNDRAWKSAIITITSNSKINPIKTINIAGKKDSIILASSPSTIDLGTYCPNDIKHFTISVKNFGDTSATFNVSSPQYFTSGSAQYNVNKNDSVLIPMTFTAPNAPSLISSNFGISEAVCGNSLQVALKATVEKPSLVISADTIYANIGDSNYVNYTFTNNGTRDVTFNLPTLNPPLSYGAPYGATFTVQANSLPKTIKVYFKPTQLSDTILRIDSFALNLSPCNVAQKWTIYAKGAVEKLANISVSDFPNQRIICKASSIDSVKITNTGNAYLKLNNAQSSLPAIFTVSSVNPLDSIAPSEFRWLRVTFTPNDRVWKNAVITITSNSKINPIKTINIAGKKDSIILSSTPSTIDLATLCPNEVKPFDISVKNIGDTTATFNVSVPANFSCATTSFTVKKDSTATVPVTFTAPSSPIVISTNFGISEAVCGNSLQVALKATVEKPSLLISADTIYANIGDSNYVNYTFTNNGTRDVTFNLPTLNPPLSYGAPYGATFTVQANSLPKTIKVYFKPTQLSDTNLLTLPLSLTLTPCLVAQPWTIYAKGAVEKLANISVSDFPNQRIICKASSIDSVKITNTGNAYLKLISAVSSLPAIFNITPVNANDSIAPSEFRWLRVTFTPNDRAWKSAIITITSNSKNNPIKTINIAGKKDSIILSSTPSTIDLATLCPNEVKPFDISVKNIGDTTATFNVSVPANFSCATTSFTVKKDSTAIVPVIFAAPNAPSLISSNFGISEAVCGNSLQVTVNAVVENPSLIITGDTIRSVVGDSNFVDFQLKNLGARDIILTMPSLTSPFSYEGGVAPTITVKANQPSASVRIYFKSTSLADTIAQSALLHLGLNPCSANQDLTIFGAAFIKQVAKISVEDFKDQRIICENSSIDSVKVTNNGNIPLKLYSISSNNAIFQILNFTPNDSIMPGRNKWIYVKFTPKDRNWESANITISSNNDPDTSTILHINGKKDTLILSSTPKTLELGTFCYGGTKQFTINVKNSGDTIARFSVNPPQYFTCSQSQYQVNKGDSVDISVLFTAPNFNTPINSTFRIEENACNNNLTTTLNAIVDEPNLKFVIDTITSIAGSPKLQRYTFTNNGLAPITFIKPKLSYPFAYENPLDTIVTISAKSGSVSFNVIFQTTSSDTNFYTQNLTFNYDRCSKTQDWTLNGKSSFDKIAIISVSDFKHQSLLCENSTIDSVKIYNVGNIPLTIKSATSSNNTEFEILKFSANTSIKANDSACLFVRFTPKSRNLTSSIITIISNNKSDSITHINISGKKDTIILTPGKQLYDIGYFCKNETNPFSVSIKNDGDIATTFNVSPTANFTCSNPQITISKGATEEIHLTFTGSASAGEFTNQLIISDNICKTPKEITLKATVEIPVLTLQDETVLALVGSPAVTKVITIKNRTNREIYIDKAPALRSEFTIIDSLIGARIHRFPMTIPAGGENYYTIAFLPTDSGTIVQNLNYAFTPCSSTSQGKITGIGSFKQMSVITAPDHILPELVCESSRLDTINIKNDGNIPLKIKSVTLGGTNLSEFNIVKSPAGDSILPTLNKQIIVSFTPNSIGPKSAYLIVKNSSSNDTTFKINLNGQKYKSDISAIDTVVYLGVLCPDEKTQATFSIKNFGTIKNGFAFVNNSKFSAPSAEKTSLEVSGISKCSVEFFGRNSEGPINETIQFFDSLCNNRRNIHFVGSIEIPKLDVPSATVSAIYQTGSFKDIEITIKNNGNRAITIQNAPTLKPEFVVLETTPKAFPMAIDSMGSKTFTIRFTPSDTIEFNQPLVFISSLCANFSSAEITGRGVAPGKPTMNVIEPKLKDLTCDFEYVDTLKIDNPGGADLIIKDIKIVGANSMDYSINKGAAPDTVTVGNIKNYIVKFSPSSVGEKIASIVIKSNLKSDSIYTIPLKYNKDSINISPDIAKFEFGALCFAQDTSAQFTIKNYSTKGAGYQIVADTSIFEFETSAGYLDSGATAPIKFRFKGLKYEKDLVDTIRVIDSICNFSKIIEVKARISEPVIAAISDVYIDAELNSYNDGKIMIHNSGKDTLKIIDKAFNTSLFELIKPTSSTIVIKPFDSLEITLRYTPLEHAQIKDTLRLITNRCGYVSEIPLFGEAPAINAMISIDSVEGKAGDTIKLHLKLAKTSGMVKHGFVKGFIAYNYSLLDPLDSIKGSYSHNIRKIPFEFDLNANFNETVITKTFRACLGNDSITSIRIENIETSSNSVTVSSIDGRFLLKGICRDGGPRLIYVSGSDKAMKLVAPNPTTGFANLVCELTESGFTKIFIVNVLGETVETIFEGEPKLGKSTIPLDLSGLANGRYRIILQTPSLLESTPIELIK